MATGGARRDADRRRSRPIEAESWTEMAPGPVLSQHPQRAFILRPCATAKSIHRVEVLSVPDQAARRRLWQWLGGVGSAVVVATISGIVLAVVVPGGELPKPDPVAPTNPPPATSASPTGPPSPPFVVTVMATGQPCAGYTVNMPPDRLAPPEISPTDFYADSQQAAAWILKTGAAVSEARITLTLQGRSSSAVILQGIDVELLRQAAPAATDTIYHVDSECGGAISPRFFSLDLGAAKPVLRPEAGEDDAGNVQPAVAFPFSVSSADPEVFRIIANAGKCDCTWRLRVRWLSDGHSGVTTVDNNGQAFHTAGYDEKLATAYLPKGGRMCGPRVVGGWCVMNS
jgi:hypothetical protein